MPSCWVNLLERRNNIVTNINSTETDNYTYNVYTNGSNGVVGEWNYGGPGYDVTNIWSTAYYYRSEEIWRLATHEGIPFTEREYGKPNN